MLRQNRRGKDWKTRLKEFYLGEMFCGPGGIGLGAQNAAEKRYSNGSSIQHTWALDYHPDTVETYKHNIPGIPDENVFSADIREFDLRQLPAFNAFAFGFPCNDFSIVGQKKGLTGKYGPLYTFGVHAIALHEPAWFLAENVTGISSTNGGAAFGRILDSLAHPTRASLEDPVFAERYADQISSLTTELEYELVAHRYRFEEYGVPQARHRILIVGIRKDLAEQFTFRVPAPSRVTKTAREALESPPIPADAPNNELSRHSKNVEARLELIEPGKNAFNSNFENNPEVKLNVRGATLSNIYKKLDPNRPSYTVTGSGGGGTQMYHWDEPRGLTNRERARLQTFPDTFVFQGGRQSVKRQIGMAVPPDGAEVIIGAVLDTFAGVEYATVDASIDVASFVEKARELGNPLI